MKRFVMVTLLAVSSVAHAQSRKQVPADLKKDEVAKDIVKIEQFVFCLCTDTSGGQQYHDGQALPETTQRTGFFELGVSSLTGSAMQNVEYRIYSTSANFDTGVKNLNSVTTAPGFTNPHATWTMLNGTHKFFAIIDPNRKLPETEAHRANNKTKLTLTFTLFDIKVADPVAAGVPLGQVVRARLRDPAGRCRMVGPTNNSGSMRLQLQYIGATPPPAGTKPCSVIAEFFSGISLGNGWSLDGFSVVNNVGNDGSVAPTWQVRPVATSLYGRLNIHFTQTNRIPIDVTVRYRLKGLRGTQPTYTQ